MENKILNNIESENINIKLGDSEINLLIKDSELSKKQRINFINSWPTNNQFEIEKVFSRKLITLELYKESFRPVHFNYSEEKYFQQSVAYIIDSLDFLPYRPDIAFDFIWRAIDFLSKQIVIEDKIYVNSDKEVLNSTINSIWTNYFTSNTNIENSFNSLLQSIPLQSCEYLFKRLYSNYDLSKPNNPNKEVARLTGFDGGKTRNEDARLIIEYIQTTYSTSDHVSLRNGSRLLYKIIKGEEVSISPQNNTIIYKADFNQILNFVVNGILYTFRNDRAHGGVFSPFRSSKATLKTYAHCSFCFLVGYYLLIGLLYKRDSKILQETNLIENYKLNIELYKKLYGSNINR